MAIDSTGFLHVIWPGGPAGAHYSRAHLTEAGSARSWTKPEILLYEIVLTPDIAVGPNGVLHAAFATTSGRLSYRRSLDGGQTWSGDITIAEQSGEREGVGVDGPRLATDSRGRVHLAWGDYVYPAGWPPIGVRYTRSFDRGVSWQEPTSVEDGSYGLINMRVTEPDNVHLLWHGSIGGTHDRKYRRSADGGQSWGTAEQTVPTLVGGFTGMSGLDFDSLGTPHVATSTDTSPYPGTVGAVYHVTRIGERWSQPVPLSRNAKGLRSVESPALAIGLGNQLHVVWEDDFQRVMYTTRTIDAPPIAARAVPQSPRQVAESNVVAPTGGNQAAWIIRTPPPTALVREAAGEIGSMSPLPIDAGAQPAVAVVGTATTVPLMKHVR